MSFATSNLWDAAIAVLRGTYITNKQTKKSYLKKHENHQTTQLASKELEKEELKRRRIPQLVEGKNIKIRVKEIKKK